MKIIIRAGVGFAPYACRWALTPMSKSDNLFADEAKKIISENDVESVRQCLIARMDNAGLHYLEKGKDEIWDLLIDIRDKFDGSEYMQGKKDGLRTALALLGVDHILELNRGGAMARPTLRAVDLATPQNGEVENKS